MAFRSVEVDCGAIHRVNCRERSGGEWGVVWDESGGMKDRFNVSREWCWGGGGGGWVRWEVVFFFFNDTATTEIYTLSLHDALPIFFYIKG